jgi:translation elongation factor EF-Ts
VITGEVAFVYPSATTADFVIAAHDGAAAFAAKENDDETVTRPAMRIAARDEEKIEVRRMSVLSWGSAKV